MRSVILESAAQLGSWLWSGQFCGVSMLILTAFLCNSIRGIVQVGVLHPLMLKLEAQINKNYRNS